MTVQCPGHLLLPRVHRPYLLHEFLDLVLQVLGQVWASPAGGSGQEAEPVDGAQLSLQLCTGLEQPGQ